MCSKTRSGRDFSPYMLDGAIEMGEPIHVNFDLAAALLAAETRLEPEPAPDVEVEDSDDESELVRPPPTCSLSTREKAALAPALFADYLKSCAREVSVRGEERGEGSSMDVQWDGLSKAEFQKKKRRAQRSARTHSLVQDPTGLRGQIKSRALEHLTGALHAADDSRGLIPDADYFLDSCLPYAALH